MKKVTPKKLKDIEFRAASYWDTGYPIGTKIGYSNDYRVEYIMSDSGVLSAEVDHKDSYLYNRRTKKWDKAKSEDVVWEYDQKPYFDSPYTRIPRKKRR